MGWNVTNQRVEMGGGSITNRCGKPSIARVREDQTLLFRCMRRLKFKQKVKWIVHRTAALVRSYVKI
jgi:hypothetical protein